MKAIFTILVRIIFGLLTAFSFITASLLISWRIYPHPLTDCINMNQILIMLLASLIAGFLGFRIGYRTKLIIIKLAIIILSALCLYLWEISGVVHQYNFGPSKVHIVSGDLATIAMALQRFEIDAERFPTNEEGLNALLVRPANTSNWNGPYFIKRPIDPWGNPYQYRTPGTGENKDFDLWSMGPDGKSGTEDDITYPYYPKPNPNNMPETNPEMIRVGVEFMILLITATLLIIIINQKCTNKKSK